MNGLSKIEQRLREESKAALDALSAQTEETLREIHREYEDRAERERQEAEKKQTAAAEERLERLRSAARMETEKMSLAAKQEIMEEAFGMALKKLCTLPQEQYAAFLKKLLHAAVSTGRETVIFNHKDSMVTLPLPIPPSTQVFSKVVYLYIESVLLGWVTSTPLLICYGATRHYIPYYYIFS